MPIDHTPSNNSLKTNVYQYDKLIYHMIRCLGIKNNLSMSSDDLLQEGRKEVITALNNFYDPVVKQKAWTNHHLKFLRLKTGVSMADCKKAFEINEHDVDKSLEFLINGIKNKTITRHSKPTEDAELRPFVLGCESTYVYRHLYFRFGNLFHKSLTIYATTEKHKVFNNMKKEAADHHQGQNICIEDVLNTLEDSESHYIDSNITYKRLIERLLQSNSDFNILWSKWQKMSEFWPIFNKSINNLHSIEDKIDLFLVNICEVSDLNISLQDKSTALRRYYNWVEKSLAQLISEQAKNDYLL